FWADPNSGVGYQIQVEIPQAAMKSVEDIRNLPIARESAHAGAQADEARAAILLRNVARTEEGTSVGEYDRYNMQRMVSLTGNISGESLGTVAGRITRAIQEAGAAPPRVTVTVRGQITP